ncbi:hypothetical protein TKK_0007137 [Trichogramma kaykai]|uniref:RING-type domain-containing protein n=1 Tax=Trichogramma kaykai TaxID=54128 RepID=A0ABD2X9J4_9HYME
MPNPGLAVMLVIGVGLGAMLYYLFASTQDQQQGGQSMGGGHRHSSRSRQNMSDADKNYWNSQQSGNQARNRRPERHCAICLDDATKINGVKLVPCSHVFHLMCIEEWRSKGEGSARNLCPNCRNEIVGLEEL